MPIYELWRQATRSDTAATAFLATSLTIIFFAVNAIIQTSSHLIWAFGRDNGLICSKQLSLMHASLGVPVWALIVEEVVVIICGCIYLGSTAAFNALINTAVILQIISFAIPCALLLLRGRSERFLAKGRWFCIPGWLGWVCNGIVVVYAVIELVFFDLPTSIPTTGSSMSKSTSWYISGDIANAIQIILALFWPLWLCLVGSIGLCTLASTTRVHVLICLLRV